MFERGKAIREAKKAELVKKATQDGLQQGIHDENQRIKKLLASRGIALPPEVAAEVFGEALPTAP